MGQKGGGVKKLPALPTLASWNFYHEGDLLEPNRHTPYFVLPTPVQSNRPFSKVGAADGISLSLEVNLNASLHIRRAPVLSALANSKYSLQKCASHPSLSIPKPPFKNTFCG